MSVRTARNFIFAIFGIIFLIAIGTLVIGVGLRSGRLTPFAELVMPSLFVLMALTGWIAFRYLRCPKCKKAMSREEFRKMECATCGEKF